MLQILLVLLQSHVRLFVRGEHNPCVAIGPPVVTVTDLNIQTFSHRSEPLEITNLVTLTNNINILVPPKSPFQSPGRGDLSW